MFVPVKSSVDYQAFITGRDVNDALHCADNCPGAECVGYVEEATVRPSDTRIDDVEYARILAEVQEYNRLNPLPVLPPSRLDVLHEKLKDNDISDEEIREMLQKERGL